jgi:hypothetical protein
LKQGLRSFYLIKWLIGEAKSIDEQEIYIKTDKSKSYNLVHLKRLVAHIKAMSGQTRVSQISGELKRVKLDKLR